MADLRADQNAQIEFIKEWLRKGEPRKDILQRFTKVYKVSVKTFDNRLKIAQEAIQSEQKHIQQQAEVEVAKEIEARKTKILTVIERQEILTQIALGEIPLTKPMVCDGVIELIAVVPDWMDRKNAIAELNKMGGDYAATKSEVKLDAPMAFIVKTTDTELAKDAEDFK